MKRWAKSGQGSSYILGVQKLTMSRSFLLWFWRGFCETKAPRGQTVGGAGAEGREGRCRGPGLAKAAHLFSRSVSVTGV